MGRPFPEQVPEKLLHEICLYHLCDYSVDSANFLLVFFSLIIGKSLYTVLKNNLSPVQNLSLKTCPMIY